MSSITDKLNDMDNMGERVQAEYHRKPLWSEAWDNYFRAALTGITGDTNVVNVKEAVTFAANIADEALKLRKEKFE